MIEVVAVLSAIGVVVATWQLTRWLVARAVVREEKILFARLRHPSSRSMWTAWEQEHQEWVRRHFGHSGAPGA